LERAVTAEKKYKLICSRCRHKFAHRSKEVYPWCKVPITEMKNPVELQYTYYHCTKSQDPGCTESAIERKELERQVIQILKNTRALLPHELWLNRSFARLSGSRQELDTLDAVRASFPAATPEVQRQIAVALFSGMLLKDQRLTVTLKPPFLLREHDMPGPFDQRSFGEEAVQQEVAGA
jgi:hypothetical protein